MQFDLLLVVCNDGGVRRRTVSARPWRRAVLGLAAGGKRRGGEAASGGGGSYPPEGGPGARRSEGRARERGVHGGSDPTVATVEDGPDSGDPLSGF